MKKLAPPRTGKTTLWGEAIAPVKLKDKYVEPPFSVLDARQGRWQNRKRGWLDLGIQSELGRDAVSYQIGSKEKWDKSKSKTPNKLVLKAGEEKAIRVLPDKVEEVDGEAGTSVFDPVLCELMYTWFCPPKGLVLDPFAGGSVRGIVASLLDQNYVGVDLSEAQIKANREQAVAICEGYPQPQWIVGDSIAQAPKVEADFLFSCPPYGDLERYSDHPADLSTMSWPMFLKYYREAIRHAADRLKLHRFACFVVGSIRDKKTTQLRDLPGETVRAFEEAGMQFYNEIILVTAVGSLPVRSRQFDTSRKIGKTHQNVLIFCKGDWKKAAKRVKIGAPNGT